MTNLTPHFTVEELTYSRTAKVLGMSNVPPPELAENLLYLAKMLERIRSQLKHPVMVTSGYRSSRVNFAVGGRSTSDHMFCRAADIICPKFGSPAKVAKKLSDVINELDIGQIILEKIGGKSWVHVSTHIPQKSINRILTISDHGTQAGILE